jgi:hypothetical protein
MSNRQLIVCVCVCVLGTIGCTSKGYPAFHHTPPNNNNSQNNSQIKHVHTIHWEKKYDNKMRRVCLRGDFIAYTHKVCIPCFPRPPTQVIHLRNYYSPHIT